MSDIYIDNPVAALDANRQPKPTLSDPQAQFQNVTYGKTNPLFTGRAEFGGRIIVYEGQPRFTEGGAAIINFAVAFCEPTRPDHPRSLLRLRANGINIIYDLTGGAPRIQEGLQFRFYPGSTTQLPDPWLETVFGVGETPAYRKCAYIVFIDFPIDAYDRQIPVITGLLADATSTTLAIETFSTPTSTTIHSHPAIDWDLGLMWTHDRGTAHRLVTHRISDLEQVSDLPITNLAGGTDFGFIEEVPFFYMKECRKLAGLGSGAFLPYSPVIIDPFSAHVIAESTALFTSGSDLVAGGGYSIDNTGSNTRYLAAFTGWLTGSVYFHLYDPSDDSFAELVVTGAEIDGLADARVSTDSKVFVIVRAPEESTLPRFYVTGGTKLIKLEVSTTSESYTAQVVYTVASGDINIIHALPSEAALVLFRSDGMAEKIRTSDFAQLWEKQLSFTPGDPAQAVMTQRLTDASRRESPLFIWYNGTVGSDAQFIYVDLSTGQETIWTGDTRVSGGHYVFDSIEQRVIITDNGDPATWTNAITGGETYTYEEIVEARAGYAGYAAGEIVVQNIDDTFDGDLIDEDTTLLDLLLAEEELLNFRVLNRETIQVRRRAIGDDLVIDFELDESGVREGGDSEPIVLRFEDISQTATRLEVQTRDPQASYGYTAAFPMREGLPVPTTPSDATDTLQTTLIMGATQRATYGYHALFRRQAKRAKIATEAMPAYMEVEAGDYGLVTIGGVEYKSEVLEASLSEEWLTELTMEGFLDVPALDSLSAFYITVTGDPGTATEPIINQVPIPQGLVFANILDIPLLQRSDEVSSSDLTHRLYASIHTYDGTGGALWTRQGSHPYGSAQFFHEFTSYFGAQFGVMMLEWEGGVSFLTDYVNTINVLPVSGQPFANLPDAASYDDMIDMDTLFAVGRQGRWVLGAYQSATAEADGTYTFSGIVLGLYGTEVFIDDLFPGDYWIYLKALSTLPAANQLPQYDPIGKIDLDSPSLDAVWSYIYLSASTNPALFGIDSHARRTQQFIDSANTVKQFAPCHIEGVIDGSDVDLSWVKRSRYVRRQDRVASQWTVVPSWGTLTFEVALIVGGSVALTLPVTSGDFITVDNADLVTVYGGVPAEMTVRITPINNGLLRGFPAEETITL